MIYEVIGKCGIRVTLEKQYQDADSVLSAVDTLMDDEETDCIEVTETDEETLEIRSITKYWLEGGRWESEHSTVEDCDL